MIELSVVMTATVQAAQLAHLGGEPFPEPPDGRLGRLGKAGVNPGVTAVNASALSDAICPIPKLTVQARSVPAAIGN